MLALDRRSLCALGVAAVCWSCGAAGSTRGDKLQQAVMELNEGVRWSRVQDALYHVDPASQGMFLELHKDFGKMIQVSGYEVVSSVVDLDLGKAEIGIKITWYRVDEMEVHETVLLQRWEERDKRWLLIAEEHRSGTPF